MNEALKQNNLKNVLLYKILFKRVGIKCTIQ